MCAPHCGLAVAGEKEEVYSLHKFAVMGPCSCRNAAQSFFIQFKEPKQAPCQTPHPGRYECNTSHK